MAISQVGCNMQNEIIDVFAHVLPPKFLKQMLQIAPHALDTAEWMKNPLLSDIPKRIATIEPGHQEIISSVNLNPEDFGSASQAADLCYQANEELAQLVQKYPQIFPAAVAMVPMNNIPAALKMIDTQVASSSKIAGIQLFTRALNQSITSPEYEPLFAKMATLGKPIWLHPIFDERKPDNNLTFSWEYEQTLAMDAIVAQGYFDRYPQLKIIVHHAGAMVPYFSERIFHIQGPEKYQAFKKFYVDTALLGNPSAIQLAVDFFGVDHVLFGTDTPLGIPPIGPTKVIQQAIAATELSQLQQQQILFENWHTIQKGVKKDE